MNFPEIIFSSAFVRALGWTLLHSIWQGLVVLILAFALVWLFRKHSAIVRYSILCASLLLILATSVVTLFSLYHNVSPTVKEGDHISQVIALNAGQGSQIEPGIENEHLFASFISRADQFIEKNSHYLVLAWLTGFMFFLTRYIGGLFYIGHLKKRGTVPAVQNWDSKIHRLARTTGLRKSFEVMESIHVNIPVTIGYLKPVILFPLGMMGSLPPEQVEAILMHEMAHILRRDYLVNALQSFIEAIFFYHPAVWLISERIRTERENICDDIAVRHSNDPLTYIKALTTMEELTSKSPALANAFAGHRKRLLNRVRRVIRPAGNRIRPAEGLVTVLIMLTLGIIFGTGAGMNTTRAGAPGSAAYSAINPDAVRSISSYNDPNTTGILPTPDFPADKNLQSRDVQDIGKIDPIYLFSLLLPDTTKKTSGEEAEKEFQEQMAQKEAAMDRLEEALKQKQEAMEAYHEALKEYQELIQEEQIEKWKQSWNWEYDLDSIDSTGVFIFHGMPGMPEWNYRYDYDYDLDYGDIPDPEDPLFECPDPAELEYLYQFRGHRDIDRMRGEKPRIMIKEIDEDILKDYEDDLERLEEEYGDSNKIYEKYVIVTPPDVRIPKLPHEPRVLIDRGNNPEKIMRQELMDDGLVSPGRDYIVEIDSSNMYINGVKQSKEVFKKYKKIYEGLNGDTIQGDFSYKLIF